MRKILSVAVLAAGLTLAMGLGHPVLAAGQDTKNDTDMFKTMDTNKDGVLTKEEFAAHDMAEDFAKYDANGDGKVTRQEYDAKSANMGTMPGM